MDEHDDDLESEVHEDAEEETDSYPNTGDDFDEDVDGETQDDDETSLDDDDAEL